METGFEKIDNCNWYYKSLFTWSIKYKVKEKRIVFFGEKIEGKKISVVLKKLKIDNNYIELLKEIYFLCCCQRSKYFIRLIDILISDDKNYIFLILKDEGGSLIDIIDYAQDNEDGFDYTKVEDMIKRVIFQIICGLYLLHKNGLIHHDIKSSNILISSNGTVKIADFGSVDKIGTYGFGSLHYESPQILLKKKAKEKDDMWGVGVIMAELYQKNYPYFNNIYSGNEKISQLKSILSKYKIYINNKEININNNNNFEFIKEKVIEQNAFEKYNMKAELMHLDEINDQDAIYLIRNLLDINPEKRFTAEQALNSNYLSNYKNNFEQKEITFNNIDYDNLMNVKNKEDFLKNVELIKGKFFGDVLFE